MPNFEPVVAEGRGYELRHIGPQSAIWPNPSVLLPFYVLLNQPQMVARSIPTAGIPDSTDFAEGAWTARIGDAGDFSLTFPNKESSDGIAWRDRFASDGKNQWIEIRNDGYLESACCIEKIDNKRDQVVISGHDGLWQTKSAYERDWIITKAPRDVIERGTQVWTSTVADEFPAGALSSQWTTSNSGGGTTTIAPSGGCILHVPAASSGAQLSASGPSGVPGWRAIFNFSASTLPPLTALPNFGLHVTCGGVQMILAQGGIFLNNGVPAHPFPTSTEYQILIENDGEWVSVYVNGAFVGGVRDSTGPIPVIRLDSDGSYSATVTFQSAFVEILQPCLMAGTDTGDYVLPGDASTYPSGGLHARYYNDADLQNDPAILTKRLSPYRSQAYAGSGAPEYANQLDATIDHNAPNFAPSPGVGTDGSGEQIWFSVKWFGAVYLKLGSLTGSYTFSFTVDDGVRVWIGKTKWGDQIIDSWTTQGATTYRSPIACGSSSSLAGTNSDGSVSAKDGWYPIVIEYFQGGGGANAQFSFTPPQGYTDPGGTALTGGASVIVPSTSLSPLGCVDQRYQALSHYDLITKTAQAFDYQITCKPLQLETLGLLRFEDRFLVTNPSFENDTVGSAPANWDAAADTWWTAGATPTVVNSTSISGNKSLQVVTTASANEGVTGNTVQPAPGWTVGQVYTFSVYLKGNAGGESVSLILGHTVGGGTDFTTSAPVVLTTGWAQYSVTWAPTQTYLDHNVHIGLRTTAASAVTFFVDDASITFPSLNPLGAFPGLLAPRVREGTDYDVTLTPDDSLRSEGMVNYTNTLDGTDVCTSLWGNGAGFQNGNTGQLQALVFDPTHLSQALFDIQGWQDFSDASFVQLLQALLNSQLGLRLNPWQIIEGQPLGRYRLANTWPLPSNLAQMRWRPGDGLKVYARDVNIEDTSPRQLLLVTRAIHPNGITSSSVGFAARPRSHEHSIQQALFQVRRLGRNYQRQLVTLQGSLVQVSAGLGAGVQGGPSIFMINPNDQVVRAYVRIKAFSASDSWGLAINGTDQTSALNGPWLANGPITPDVSGVIKFDNGRMWASIINKGGGASVGEVDYQLFVDVLR